ncbi:MAG TPA: MBL fold metallo-hydrolase [Bryobacteraceae bacterium]|nr:MBL fold metallo-hydrolase [Bryobacteraceae bacterium]
MRNTFLVVIFLMAGPLLGAPGALEIYFVDVEGGGATLIVTPSGESLLADTGSPRPDDRDAKRIAQAAKLAGLKKLDYVLITHFDSDHSGGAPALAKLIPVDRFLDHGDSIETNAPRDMERWKAYLSVASGKRTSPKPGDRVALKGVRLTIVSSNGAVLAKAINGGKSNATLCKDAQQKDPDKTENARCLGFLLAFGKFTFLDLGDLTWDKEMELACPLNKLGMVTLYQATMHGFFNDRSGPPAHIDAILPQVVIVNNGARKGLLPPAYERIAKIPGIEDIWQNHLSLANDALHNTSQDRIANLEPTDECQGRWLKVRVESDGKYTVTNSRNNFSKTYTAR